jgi:type III secretion protein Q
MSLRPLALPRLSRAEAAALRMRCAPRATLAFACGATADHAWRLSLDSAQLDSTHSAMASDLGPDPVCLALDWGRERLELGCPAALPRQLLHALEPALESTTMPPDLTRLLLAAAMLPALSQLEQASGRDIVITGLGKTAARAAPDGLHLRLDHNDHAWLLRLTGARSSIAALLTLWPVAPRAMGGLVLPAALRIGATQLPLAVLKSLRVDDKILLQIGDGIGGTLVLAESWLAAAEQEGGIWRLTEAPKPARASGEAERTMLMHKPIDDNTASAGIADPDQLPVQLTFEIGRLEMTVAELRLLGPGSVLELGRSISELVRISAQGQTIGQGRLVDVDGAAGVQVVRMFDHG